MCSMNYAILLAGGTGRRIQSTRIPKQFVRAGERMMATYALEPLLRSNHVDRVCVVAEHEYRDLMYADAEKAGLDVKKITCCAIPANTGRQGSVLNAMQEILRDICGEVDVEQASDDDSVLIHDAARPFLTVKLVDDCYEAFDGHDGIMTVLPLYDNIYRTKEEGWTIEITLLDRNGIVIEQTPAIFLLKKYYKANMALMPDKLWKVKGVADPALMAGLEVVTFDGDEQNIKITTESDLEHYLLAKNGDTDAQKRQ